MSADEFDSDFIADITPHVIGVLKASGFFERLDDRLCPAGQQEEIPRCPGHTFGSTQSILLQLAMSNEEIAEIIAVLRARGACCDCEILYNVAEESRLRSKYWKLRAAKGS